MSFNHIVKALAVSISLVLGGVSCTSSPLHYINDKSAYEISFAQSNQVGATISDWFYVDADIIPVEINIIAYSPGISVSKGKSRYTNGTGIPSAEEKQIDDYLRTFILNNFPASYHLVVKER